MKFYVLDEDGEELELKGNLIESEEVTIYHSKNVCDVCEEERETEYSVYSYEKVCEGCYDTYYELVQRGLV